MKKLSITIMFFLMVFCRIDAQQAKYVFYFIGDGMGVNQVQGTELYLGELEGKIGITPLQFTQFPYTTVATTFSATNGVTDSAAAGTALATGNKTKNGAIGVLKDLQTPVYSVATWAKQHGCRVGVATSVSIDHATPAAFYAHASGRGSYYEIGKDLYETGFDFYAGSDFLQPQDKNNPQATNLYSLADQYGYIIARGYKDYLKKSKKADKMILFQPEAASKADLSKGFFLMVEGGKIDWACHSNDAATTFHEVIDFDNAIKVAYEFYSQHPDETLIVVTADHETGGFVLGKGPYELNLQVLKNQKVSESGFTKVINQLRSKTNNQVSWETVQQALKDNFGFWDKIQLNEKQEARLKNVYEQTMKNQQVKMEKSEYAQDEPIAAEAKRIINEIALTGWTSGGHSAGYVPVFAIGAGAEKFQNRIDNTEIPVKIAEAAGYSRK